MISDSGVPDSEGSHFAVTSHRPLYSFRKKIFYNYLNAVVEKTRIYWIVPQCMLYEGGNPG